MATYVTANGLVLPISQTPDNWPAGTTASETQIGTSGNDQFQGSGGDLLIGGAGDDTYFLWDSASSITEQASQGVDTVYAEYWGAATLSDNVENLFLMSDGSTSGTGNALNNIIVAGAIGATLDGGAGDDVLVGGAGADIFKVTAGNGSDAIVNFKPSSDVVKLGGYGISSFDQLMSLATQNGSDVQFSFANGEKLVLRDVNLSDLSAYDFGLPAPVSALQPGYSQLVGSGEIAVANGWVIFNNVWNPGSLGSKDYSITGSYKAADLTDHTTFTWSFPLVTEAVSTVRAYPEISFGPNPLSDVQTPAPGAVFPVQLSSLSGLTASFDLSYQGNMDGFDVSFDVWLTSVPNGGASTITNEVMVWLHKGDVKPFGDLIGTYQDGTISAKIYHGDNNGRPYTAVVLDTDLPAGSIDFSGILNKLQSLGIVSSSEYLASIELGAEVVSGAGSLTINDLNFAVKTKDALGAVTSTTVTGTDVSSTVTTPGTTSVPVIGSFSPDTNVVGDGLTSANKITLSGGAAVVGSTIVIYDGGTKIGTAITGADNSWSFTTSTLSDGTHVFTSKMIDSAGNVSASSAALNVTVDTTAPNAPTLLSITPDSNIVGDGVTSANQITLHGAAAAGITVQIYESGNLIGTAVAGNDGLWSLTTATLADGKYSFSSKAIDAAGNVSATSASYGVTIDTVAPNKPAFYGTASDGHVVTNGATNANHITLNGAALPNSTIKIFDGSTQIGTATVDGNGVWTFVTAALADGSHTLTAKTMDAAGNLSAASTALAVTVDTVAPDTPVLLSFSPDSNIAGDGITSANKITLNGAAAIGSTVKIYDGGTLIGTAVVNSSGLWSYATSALSDGTHSFTSKVIDTAGNLSAASSAMKVTIDTVAPNKPGFSAFAPDGHLVTGGAVNANHITMSGGAAANSTIKIFDGTTQVGTASVDSNGVWSFTTAALADGSHTLTAKTMDAAGNLSAASTALSITVDTVAPDAPALQSFSPDSNVVGDGITSANQITLNGAAAAGATIKIYDGSIVIGTAVANSSGLWSYATAALSDGTHTFTSKAVDTAGNYSTASSALNVTVDTVAPNKPGFSAFAPDGHLITSGDTNANHITLDGGAAANSTVKIYDGATQIGTASVDGNGVWSFTTAALTDGSHTLTAKAMDAAGNLSAASTALNVAVDTMAPDAPAVLSFSPDSNVVGDGITNASKITLAGAATAGLTVKIYDGSTQIGSTTAGSDGTWSFATAALSDGNHNFTSKAIDTAGNVSAASSALKVTVDTVAPNAPNFTAYDTSGHAMSNSASTSVDQFTLKGGAAANMTIEIFDGSTRIGTTTANSSGAWSFTTAALADGNHVLTGDAVDAAGNHSAVSAALNLTVWHDLVV
ncbi:Ig-like domain-containing protein [Bradyrhizobium betae]|uniref:Bacterial Ig-like domain-containing protein n=1 Tax=Bradyrhizobium betae TaxID=244734 RepID=A0A4Q1V8F8_9BRAD|nr:Ig-like domain-containing protein [Bradyrhizobium betae]RXT47722.1 hypothetical protein B5V03_15740 [Bradyrhizobium betae]